MTTLNDSPSRTRRILCFIVFALAYAAPNYAQYQFSPLGTQIIETYGLSGVQFNSIFTAPMLPAVFLSLISGLLVDRYGYKPVLGVSILLTALGAVTRVFANGYGLMYAAMIFLGFSAAFISANASKVLSVFFKPEKISVIMGLVLTITTTGMVLSMATTTSLGIRRAFILAAALAVAVLVLWVALMPNVKPRKEEGAPERVSLGKAFLAVVKNRHVWVAAGVIFFLNGAMTGMSANIPTALKTARGFTDGAADIAGAVLMVGNLLGSLLTPTISLKTGKFRLVLILCGLVSLLGCTFSWRLPGIWLYVGLILTGYTFGSGMAQLLSVAIRLPGVGPAFAGTAGGLIATLDLLGGVVLPTYVASPIAGSNLTVFFLILGLLGIPWMLGVYLLPRALDEKG